MIRGPTKSLIAARDVNLSKRFCRSLFQKFKSAKNEVSEAHKNESFHHEYSIRPDNFAFKVSGANESGRSIVGGKLNENLRQKALVHPLQKGRRISKLNVIDYIYTNATNYPFNEKSPQDIFNAYPTTNSAKLSRKLHRPKKVKMLASDFIEDALYNLNYGYFSKEVEIFHLDKPFEYNNIEDVDAFLESWQNAYAKYDENFLSRASQRKVESDATPKEDLKQANKPKNLPVSKFAKRAIEIQEQENKVSHQQRQTQRSMQLWHTPTELFQPYYGEALARYLLVNYKLNGNYPYEDLIIYEMGGGNGTLMCNILNYIKENQPDVYNRTQYKIIEILSQLAEKQLESALKAMLFLKGLDSNKLEIINKSIFEWDKVVEDPCFFIALEVFDNFAHDVIRYDNITGEPHEGHVLIDEHGDFYEFFTPELSYYSQAYLSLREHGHHSVLKTLGTATGTMQSIKSIIPFTDKNSIHPIHYPSSMLRLKNLAFPFKDNLTKGEFIPTRLLKLFQILKHKFPHHLLLCSDFNHLPNSINGYYNAPVVQTMIQNQMVDVSTYMCHQGCFDIMFPTDFSICSDLYRQVTGKIPRVELHRDFLENWADLEITTTKKGENPMLDFYTNVSFMVS